MRITEIIIIINNNRNINTKFDVEVPVLPETVARAKIEAE